jgi:hypothetical protein
VSTSRIVFPLGEVAQSGAGGRASHPQMVLAGPLISSSYTIVIGAGGKSGASGGDTTFQDLQLTFRFAGGVSGSEGGNAAGENSSYGPGGTAAPGPGKPGGDAVARCAGGGGGGELSDGNVPEGGLGGPGYLVVYPLPEAAKLAK